MNKAPMAHSSRRWRTPWLASAIVGALSLAGTATAQTSLPPNLIPLGAFNTTLATDSGGRSTLRFSTTTWNAGAGPLELAAGEVETGSGKLRVYQVVYQSGGSSILRFAGAFEYHPQHDHMHFNDYALYTLQPVNAPGGSARTGAKTTFCVMDNTPINLQLQGAPGQPFYRQCGRELLAITLPSLGGNAYPCAVRSPARPGSASSALRGSPAKTVMRAGHFTQAGDEWFGGHDQQMHVISHQHVCMQRAVMAKCCLA